MKNQSQIRIAFFLNDFHNEYSVGICNGALKAAKELGISMVFFGVGSLESTVQYTVMRNRLFSILSPEDFDGLLYISSSIANFVGVDKFLDFIKQYNSVPSAHIGINSPGLKCYNIDNRSGMYELVDHFIKAHGRKKIAFINGTIGVHEADERFEAYKNALKDNGIDFDENYVYEGNFLREKGIQAVEEFLDVRKIEIDGIVGANDHMALYAMKELQKRGYNIPEDISVGGFDDLASARSHTPAMSTVHQPVTDLGYLAVTDFVRNLITGGIQTGDMQLPTQMVLRQSCGCTETHSEKIFDDSNEMTISERDELDSILNIMTRNIIGSFEENEIRNVLDESIKIFDITDFSLAKYVDHENSIIFYDKNGHIGTKFPSKSLVNGGLDTFTAPFCKFLLPLFYRNEDIGFFISDSGTKSLSVLEVMRDHLSGALKGARLLDDAKRYTETLEKMVEERTGELEKRSAELEVALHNVKLASEKLEWLAVIDELTGLYNRRGFMTIAKQNIELINRNKSNVLLVFLDLDGLKHINDNFGHASGDIAIKALGEILVKSFRKSDVIARLGGDEFTVLAINCNFTQYNQIIERMNSYITEYNRTSGYDFHLAVSCGAAPYKAKENCVIEELMEEADRELYKAKNMKKKGNYGY
ncbi:MAG: GGDEF domain-containing protein [Spirochaetes bacterium]|nr:GGDEF domain-containing protein [Spirochaetota bacterium]